VRNKKNNPKKQKWSKFIITKIKLNPEQAVLSCCNFSSKAGVTGSIQCYPGMICGMWVTGPTNGSS